MGEFLERALSYILMVVICATIYVSYFHQKKNTIKSNSPQAEFVAHEVKENPSTKNLNQNLNEPLGNCSREPIGTSRSLTKNARIRQSLTAVNGIKKAVVVAVIDTGAEVEHASLSRSIWSNPGESGLDAVGLRKETNGIDDDQNGFIDDVHGWNFVSDNNDLSDHHGHGTHFSGIIKNVSDDGAPPLTQIMILKYVDPLVPNSDNLEKTRRAINYAVMMKAQIINYSGGGSEGSSKEYEEIRKADKSGILFVAAAGNEHSNSDINPYYPADYKLENIISVAAIDPYQNTLNFSNYGTRSVDISAPGERIFSLLPNQQSGCMSGTSQAAAVVSGHAAMLLADGPADMLPMDLKSIIVASAKKSPSLKNKSKSQGFVDLEEASKLINIISDLSK
jgi:thermitase